MKHIQPITTTRADAYIDLLNALWRAWRDFQFAKKNEIGL